MAWRAQSDMPLIKITKTAGWIGPIRQIKDILQVVFFFFDEFYNYPPNTRPRLECPSQSLKRNQHLLMQLPGVTTCERETEQDVSSPLCTGERRVLTDGLGGNAQDNWETRALDRNSGPWLKEWKAF